MHPNQSFRQTPTERNIAFARDRSFGVLSVNADNGPLLAHIPFLLDIDGKSADLHLVRSNPIIRLLASAHPAVIAINGPDGYISPDWYEAADQVPTWNYVAVHLRGTLEKLPQDDIRSVIDRLSAHFEARLALKTPWTSDKMTPDVLDKMMKMIVPCRLRINDIQGTWKLGQNKADAARIGAANHVADGAGAELAALAQMMHDPQNA